MMFHAVRPGPDHAHMAPKIVQHMKDNNFEKMPDRFGRKDASFYGNYFRQEMGVERPTTLVQ